MNRFFWACFSRRWPGWPFLSILAIASVNQVTAVILYSTASATANTAAPDGTLAGSGWQWQGNWGSFLGTPISSHHFITAGHVGGSIGQTFTFGGVLYTSVALFDDPSTDLRIWEVSGTFPTFAPLHMAGTEAGQDFVVFGRGTQRGSEVNVSPSVGGSLKGWQYGAVDAVQRWGENTVEGVASVNGLGSLLVADFDAAGGVNEAHLSTGDSGGGVFINDGGTWKLAGINYGVDGPYNTSTSGGGFDAALFDEGGLYQKGTGNWTLEPDQLADLPGSFYAMRISSNTDWILTVIPEPSGAVLLAGTSLVLWAGVRAWRARER